MEVAEAKNTVFPGAERDCQLYEGETLYWRGQPEESLHLRKTDWILMLFGATFSALPIFWVLDEFSTDKIFWENAVGAAIFFSVGFFIFFKPLAYDSFVRHRTRYALTSERAIILKRSLLNGWVLEAYRINKATQIRFKQGRLSTIDFAVREHQGDDYVWLESVGFENISKGEEVLALIRQIQSELK